MTGDPGVRGTALDIETAVVHPIWNPAPDAEPERPGSGSGDDSDSGQQSAKDGMRVPGPRSRSDLKKPLKIDVPFEIVVACGPEGVVIHPGGYRLSAKALKSNEGLLLRDLKTIVQTRRQVDPTIHPSLRSVSSSSRREARLTAMSRRQTMLSGLDWPVAIQVSDTDILDNISPRGPF